MFETVEIGPAFPSMGGLVVTIPTFELATTLTSAMEKNPATPSITMLPYIDVRALQRERERERERERGGGGVGGGGGGGGGGSGGKTV